MIIEAEPDPTPEPPDLPGSLARYLKTLKLAEAEKRPVVLLHDAPAQFQSGRTLFQGAQAELMMGENSIEPEEVRGRIAGFLRKNNPKPKNG